MELKKLNGRNFWEKQQRKQQVSEWWQLEEQQEENSESEQIQSWDCEESSKTNTQ